MATSGRARLDRPTLGCGAWDTTLDTSGSCSEIALSVAQMAQVPNSLWLVQGPLLYTSKEGTRSGEGEQETTANSLPSLLGSVILMEWSFGKKSKDAGRRVRHLLKLANPG